jgi:serpin B
VDDNFILLDGQRITVQMMSWRSNLFADYVQGEGYQAVELDYRGGNAQMIVLLPDQGRFEDIESLLSKDLMEEILQSLAPTHVKLSMPRFEFEASLRLANTLAGMGMRDAFTPRADFTGITASSSMPLYIGDVLHKSFVAVDELGTEAAAATAAIAVAASGPTWAPTVVRIDRPFIFVIRDIENRTVLFVGRVLDPTK